MCSTSVPLVADLAATSENLSKAHSHAGNSAGLIARPLEL